MITVAVFDTKPYDREALQQIATPGIKWHFLDFRLNVETAPLAKPAKAVCVFVNDRLDRPCLEALATQGVELITLRCAGFNNVDLAAAKALKLTVTRVPAYSPHAVAEHAAALLLALNRKVYRAYNRVRDQNFSLHGLVGFDLNAKTAGIIGTGKIGRIFAEILRGFGMTVLACDPFPAPDWAKPHGVTYTDQRTLLQNCDIVSLHTPLTPETKHLIREETLALMKPNSVLINVSRGALIDTTALIAALKSGQLAGVGLDVYEEEEGIFFEDLSDQVLQDDELARLLTFPNVLITSHQAFLTREALAEIARVTVANLTALVDHTPFVPGSVLT